MRAYHGTVVLAFADRHRQYDGVRQAHGQQHCDFSSFVALLLPNMWAFSPLPVEEISEFEVEAKHGAGFK